MDVLISISDEIYRHAKDGSEDSNDEWNAMRAIANGTPIPDNATVCEWIPMTKRPMTDDEKEYYKEELEYCDDAEIFDCKLPEDDEEVLITMNGWVTIDTFDRDFTDGCSFEGYDIDDVKAWMPLPEPYKPQESEDKE